ncbi:glycoside hydrolase 5 family protein [Galbibacter mesophilus]|uniref:cellulase family glycosylhydrolase n=1 Tax=Galbibacter mesophilus TaxID=379069 RepID=UPI00191D08E2|nr:cellulase family glycosylhydrolase [Galbibacter mesophilus]MCM5661810.1 glycoside hydrolase family 5 protein [Galbibacter mesophilus]
MKYRFNKIITATIAILSLTASAQINDSIPVKGKWEVERVNEWYEAQPWLVGCNYYPATAINQIEMWQESTWDPKRIDLELGWAEDIGMNTLRVYLHDLVWADDEEGLYDRMEEFLNICQSHGIRPFFVFFDDCHMPNPELGIQPLPVKGYHNSGWVNSPSRDLAVRYSLGKATPEEIARLKGYVQKTMQRFSEDERILMWELYNEPGRGQGLTGNMESTSVADAFGDQSKQLVYDSWCWAREVNPSQPITSTTLGAVGDTNIRINKINSDVNSVHSYAEWERTKKRLKPYEETGRPIFLTEWLGRNNGSTVNNILPKLKKHNIAAINWGFVSGKTGTIWHWDSRKDRDVFKEREDGNVIKPGETYPEPDLWFHDLFRTDGTPYDEGEIQIFKKLTGKN